MVKLVCLFYVNAAVLIEKINALNRPGDPNNQLSRGLTWNKVGRSPDDYFLVPYAGLILQTVMLYIQVRWY
jgi:hypothetical protein